MQSQRNIVTMKKASTFVLVLLGWLMVSSQALDKNPEVKESAELGTDTKGQNETESLPSVKKFSMIVVLKVRASIESLILTDVHLMFS